MENFLNLLDFSGKNKGDPPSMKPSLSSFG